MIAQTEIDRLRALAVDESHKGNAIDILGNRFFDLTVVSRNGLNSKCEATWNCICDCGNSTVVSGCALRAGHIKSCGCKKLASSKNNGKMNVIHGHARAGVPTSKTYNTWVSMVARCHVKNHISYPRYGAKGISVCKEWMNFAAFLSDMGERPPGTTIDRINNSLGYLPGNCKWSTHLEQQNNRTSNVFISAFGKTQTISQWSRETGIHKSTIARRFFSGKDSEFSVSGASRNRNKQVVHHE